VTGMLLAKLHGPASLPSHSAPHKGSCCPSMGLAPPKRVTHRLGVFIFFIFFIIVFSSVSSCVRQETGEELSTHYNLADTLYAKATVECTGTVCLWLGVRRARW
jgi:hypothetical protein